MGARLLLRRHDHPLVGRKFVDTRARLSPSARIKFVLKVVDSENSSITELVVFRLDGGGLEVFLKEFIDLMSDRQRLQSDSISSNRTLNPQLNRRYRRPLRAMYFKHSP